MAKGKYRDKNLEDAETASPAMDAPAEDTGAEGVTVAVDDHYFDRQSDSAAKLTDLDFEYQAAANAAGKEEKTYGIWGPIWRISEWVRSKKKEHTVNKKTYLILLVLLGWMGGHRYYEHRWVVAVLYTALFWTCIPLAMCVIDAMIVIPKKADENGCIVL